MIWNFFFSYWYRNQIASDSTVVRQISEYYDNVGTALDKSGINEHLNKTIGLNKDFRRVIAQYQETNIKVDCIKKTIQDKATEQSSKLSSHVRHIKGVLNEIKARIEHLNQTTYDHLDVENEQLKNRDIRETTEEYLRNSTVLNDTLHFLVKGDGLHLRVLITTDERKILLSPTCPLLPYDAFETEEERRIFERSINDDLRASETVKDLRNAKRTIDEHENERLKCSFQPDNNDITTKLKTIGEHFGSLVNERDSRIGISVTDTPFFIVHFPVRFRFQNIPNEVPPKFGNAIKEIVSVLAKSLDCLENGKKVAKKYQTHCKVYHDIATKWLKVRGNPKAKSEPLQKLQKEFARQNVIVDAHIENIQNRKDGLDGLEKRLDVLLQCRDSQVNVVSRSFISGFVDEAHKELADTEKLTEQFIMDHSFVPMLSEEEGKLIVSFDNKAEIEQMRNKMQYHSKLMLSYTSLLERATLEKERLDTCIKTIFDRREICQRQLLTQKNDNCSKLKFIEKTFDGYYLDQLKERENRYRALKKQQGKLAEMKCEMAEQNSASLSEKYYHSTTRLEWEKFVARSAKIVSEEENPFGEVRPIPEIKVSVKVNDENGFAYLDVPKITTHHTGATQQ